MKAIYLIIIILISDTLVEQNGFLMHGHDNTKEELLDQIVRFESKNISNYDDKKLSIYYLDKSSLYLYLEKDSALVLFFKY